MIQPLEDRVLFEKLDTNIENDIIVSADPEAGMPSFRGKVLAVGDSTKLVKVGDEIIYGQFAPIDVKDGDKKLKIVSEGDIIAINKE